MEELARLVIKWWDKHQFDTYSEGKEEWNTYDETPDFVVKAQEIINNL